MFQLYFIIYLFIKFNLTSEMDQSVIHLKPFKTFEFPPTV